MRPMNPNATTPPSSAMNVASPFMAADRPLSGSAPQRVGSAVQADATDRRSRG